MGGAGAGTKTKLVNNLVFAAQSQVACFATELGSKLGIDSTALLPALGASAARSYAMNLLNVLNCDIQAF
jgi:3-hydroxyisobutyrate dehydrogenase-like beta-hydroxyacid dehydrogenase